MSSNVVDLTAKRINDLHASIVRDLGARGYRESDWEQALELLCCALDHAASIRANPKRRWRASFALERVRKRAGPKAVALAAEMLRSIQR
jgi:hypothetical protein